MSRRAGFAVFAVLVEGSVALAVLVDWRFAVPAVLGAVGALIAP